MVLSQRAPPRNEIGIADAECDITEAPHHEYDKREPLARSKNQGCGEPETSPWLKCLQLTKVSDKETIKYWNEEIDSLLLLAALFSAVVAGFVVDSYKSLQPDPNQNVAQILSQISLQLSSMSVQSGFLNSTHSPYIPPPPSSSSQGSVRTNILWISSLILSLTAALYGIFARQWLREFVRRCADGPNSSVQESLRTRQFYYDGLLRWRIPVFMTFLPLLLQASLVLFLAGLADMLWMLDRTVATFATAMTVSTVLGAIIFAAAPAFSTACPYISPLSSLVTRLVQAVVWILLFPVGCVLFLRALCNTPRSSVILWHRCLSTNARTAIERLTRPGRHMILPGLHPSSSRHKLPSSVSPAELDHSAFAWFYRHGRSTTSPPSETELLECFADLPPLYQAEAIRNIVAMEYDTSLKTLLKYAEDMILLERGMFRLTTLPPRPLPTALCTLLLDMVKLATTEAVPVVPAAEGNPVEFDSNTKSDSQADRIVSDRLLIHVKQYLEPGFAPETVSAANSETASMVNSESESSSLHSPMELGTFPATCSNSEAALTPIQRSTLREVPLRLPMELVTFPTTSLPDPETASAADPELGSMVSLPSPNS